MSPIKYRVKYRSNSTVESLPWMNSSDLSPESELKRKKLRMKPIVLVRL